MDDLGETGEMFPVPDGRAFVVVMEPTAHLDWDWLNCFPYNVDMGAPSCGPGGSPCNGEYFTRWDAAYVKPANTIYQQVAKLLRLPQYRYSACEVGFLRAFANGYPSEFREMVNTGRLRLVGGGITSPDNLLPHGECFIRCFLVGLNWAEQQGLPWTGAVWIPDDFGHDSQLPALLTAMGATSVGFARVPGGTVYNGKLTATQPTPLAGTVLLDPTNGGLDFFWAAADGSSVLAHWMPNAYSQGYNDASISWQDIVTYADANQPASPTAYVHVPCAWDFGLPIGHTTGNQPAEATLQKACDEYNTRQSRGWAVVGTFDQYAAWVRAWQGTHGPGLKRRTFGDAADDRSFRSNPYFMGFYASRMALKRLHNHATRTLLAAETFDLADGLISGAGGRSRQFETIWNNLVPSTHHDYITGTATDCVYVNEQLPLLEDCARSSDHLLTQIQVEMASRLPSSQSRLVVFNALGFDRSGVVEVSAADADRMNVSGVPVQRLADRRALVWGGAPSLGYEVHGTTGRPPAAPVQMQFSGAKATLSNGLVSVTVEQSRNWQITSMTDLATGIPVLGGPGNGFKIFQDGGSIYSFGYECASPSFTERKFDWTASPARVTEGTPGSPQLRCTVAASVTAHIDGFPWNFEISYSLSAGEPFVRISVTGACPPNSSMFVYFPLHNDPFSMHHGTPYHWDTKGFARFGTSPVFDGVFQPTHDFVDLRGHTEAGITIYHADVPAWALDKGSTVVGCVLRNTGGDGCDGRGASGTDTGTHTIRYALRAPSPNRANTGAMLREARAFSSPLVGRFAPGGGSAPPVYSVAGTPANEPCLLTAAKRGTREEQEIYLRIYNPSNQERRVVLTTANFNGRLPRGVTAVERPLPPDQERRLQITNAFREVHFTAVSSITTIQFTPRQD